MQMTSSALLNGMDPFPMLAIHDRDDAEATFAHLEHLMEHVPQVETIATSGLGHTRILRNQEVIEKVKDFLRT